LAILRGSEIALADIVSRPRANDATQADVEECPDIAIVSHNRLGKCARTDTLVLGGHILGLDELGAGRFVGAIELPVGPIHVVRLHDHRIDPIAQDRLDDAAPLGKSRCDVSNFREALGRNAQAPQVCQEVLSVLAHVSAAGAQALQRSIHLVVVT
jgi:hypothetical protein